MKLTGSEGWYNFSSLISYFKLSPRPMVIFYCIHLRVRESTSLLSRPFFNQSSSLRPLATFRKGQRTKKKGSLRLTPAAGAKRVKGVPEEMSRGRELTAPGRFTSTLRLVFTLPSKKIAGVILQGSMKSQSKFQSGLFMPVKFIYLCCLLLDFMKVPLFLEVRKSN